VRVISTMFLYVSWAKQRNKRVKDYEIGTSEKENHRLCEPVDRGSKCMNQNAGMTEVVLRNGSNKLYRMLDNVSKECDLLPSVTTQDSTCDEGRLHLL